MNHNEILGKGTSYPDRKRVGRGPGSGLGKTSGRGHKGWGARSGAPRRAGYEGGQMPIYRRVPKRGFTNHRFKTEFTIINVEKLNEFEDGQVVDLALVLERGLTTPVAPRLKVLGNGKLERKLTVKAERFTASAKSKIEQSGGQAIAVGRAAEAAPAE